MRICLELSDLCIFLSAVILPGLRFGAGTRTIPWWTCYHLRARTEAQKRHQSTHTNRQTDAQDRGTDTQANTAAKQSGDINIVVSRLMQEKKNSNIKI